LKPGVLEAEVVWSKEKGEYGSVEVWIMECGVWSVEYGVWGMEYGSMEENGGVVYGSMEDG
jgi:hypothetical protein